MKKYIAITLAVILAATPVYVTPVYAEEESTSDDSFITELISVIEEAGEKVGYSVKSAQAAAEEAADAAGDMLKSAASAAGEAVGNAADAVGKTAGNLSSLTKEKVENAQKSAKNAIDTLTGAVFYVIDNAGNIINMVSETAGRTTETAKLVIGIIKEYGPVLIDAAQDSLSKLDLSDDESEEKLERTILITLTGLNKKGIIGRNLDDKTIMAISDVTTKTIVYGWRYSQGMLSLSEYVSLMSELIIRNGLPAGVGFLANMLPLDGASDLAYKATTYLIEKAYDDGVEEDAVSESAEVTGE